MSDAGDDTSNTMRRDGQKPNNEFSHVAEGAADVMPSKARAPAHFYAGR